MALTAPADGTVLGTATPQITGTGSTGATDATSVTVRIYSGSSASGSPIQTLTPALASGAFATAAASLADGTYTVQATQADQAGNVGTSAARTFRDRHDGADRDDHSSRLTAARRPRRRRRSPGRPGTTRATPATVTVKVYSGSSVSGSPIQTLTATRSGTAWSVPASAALALGTYTAQAEQSDSVGHTGRSAPSTFTIVAPPPSNQAPMCTDGTKIGAERDADVDHAHVHRRGRRRADTVDRRAARPRHARLDHRRFGHVHADGHVLRRATRSRSRRATGRRTPTSQRSRSPSDRPVLRHRRTTPRSCTDGTKTTPNATPASITLACTDADGDALTLSIVAAPGHGSLGSINAGSVTYTPTGTYAGSDSFTFKASDGKADSNVATISITVGPASPPTPTPTPKPKPKKCTVPQVVGKTLDVARDAIKKAHCATGKVNYARSRKVKKNVVLAQSHRPGQKLAVNTKINLVVSRGKK